MRIDGHITVAHRLPSGLLVPLFAQHNEQMVSSGFAIAKTLGLGDVSYRINKMYFEFENVATPATAVSVPSFDNTEGREYYAGLSAPKDYLRVDLLGQPTLGIADGYEAYFTEGVDGNQLTFLAQSEGVAGVNGLTFSNALNSKLYGIALVSAPSESDVTQDVIIERAYFAVANQQVKPAAGQLTTSWVLDFIPP
jgi:hypothetical protein